MNDTHTFSRSEEIANAISHGIGALLSICALVLLIVTSAIHGDPLHIVSFTIFGVTMTMMYFSSTLLHSLPKGKAKDLFEILDHSSIYFFIAGTYTPFLFLVIDDPIRWVIFGIVWGIAIGGTIFKCFFVKKFVMFSTLLYVAMGWLIVLAWKPLVANLPYNGLLLLIAGGLLYTIGAIFYVWRGFKFHHTVWHLFVIGGSAFHFFCIFLYLIP